MKGIFKNRSALFQTGILFTMLLFGFVISMFLGTIILLVASLINGNIEADLLSQPVFVLQSTQFFSALFLFLFPAWSTAWLCSDQPNDFLHIRACPAIRLLALVSLTTLLLSPAVSLTSYLNEQIHFPASMAAVEEWMKATEENANQLIQYMISGKGITQFIINLLVIAVAAGVTEEFLFRGALLRLVQKGIRNHHASIWLVAIIFSAIHFQFYGFIPRMLLGAYMGYLLYWTKNIWVPVFAHFMHNAVAFIGMSNESLKENVLFTDEIAPEDIRWLSITAGICLIVFAYLIGIVRKMEREAD
jgi:membrane protease YdiL (CAAX protease family)